MSRKESTNMAIGGTELICNLQRGPLGEGDRGGIGRYDYEITYSLYRGEGPVGKMSVSQTLHYHVEDFDNTPFSGDFTFSGDDIRSQTSELGTLLTVTFPLQSDGGGVAGQGPTSSEEAKFTLLIPIDEQQLKPFATTPINALAIQTRSQGQLLSYQVYSLQGTAHLDLFP